MGLLVIELIIGGVLLVAFTIIGLFFGHIILFDSIAIGLVAGLVSHGLLEVHPAIALVIGIAVFLVLFFLQNTKVGFWIVGGLMSLAWGLIFASMAYEFTGKDMIWTYTVFGLGTLIIFLLHLKAKNT